MHKFRGGGARNDWVRGNGLPPDTYNSAGQKRYYQDARGRHLDQFGEVTQFHDQQATTDYFTNRVNESNWHESGMTWRNFDDSTVRKTLIGANNDGSPIFHYGTAPRTHGRRLGNTLTQGSFPIAYRKDQTHVVPFSAAETGLSMSVDTRKDISPQERQRENIRAHAKATSNLVAARKGPDVLQKHTDDNKGPIQSRTTPKFTSGDRGDQAHNVQLRQSGGAGDTFAKYHNLQQRDDEIMKRLRIGPDGQIQNAKLAHTPMNVAYTSGQGVDGYEPVGPSIDYNNPKLKDSPTNAAMHAMSNSGWELGGPTINTAMDTLKLNDQLARMRIGAPDVEAGNVYEYMSDSKFGDTSKSASPYTKKANEFYRALDQANDVNQLESIIVQNYANLREASAKSSAKSKHESANEVDKQESLQLVASLRKYAKENPRLWETVSMSENPQIQQIVDVVKSAAPNAQYRRLEVAESVAFLNDLRNNGSSLPSSGRDARDLAGANGRAMTLENRLMEEKTVANQAAKFAHLFESSGGIQLATGEREGFDDKINDHIIPQTIENVGPVDRNGLLESNRVTPVQNQTRAARYSGKVLKSGRVNINLQT